MTEFIDLPKIYTKDRMPVTHEHIPKREEISKWNHLSNITLPNVTAEIGLLIGSNVPDAYAPFEGLPDLVALLTLQGRVWDGSFGMF
jgi:hypothetical protein